MADTVIVPIRTVSGALTFQLNLQGRRVLLHSRYDPEKEAARFIDSKGLSAGETVVVFGFGLGYHVREILRQVGPSGKVHVIEPNVELLREAGKHLDLTPLFKDGRLTLSVGGDLTGLSGLITECLGSVMNGKGRLIIHRPSLEAAPVWAAPVKQVLLEWLIKEDTVDRYGNLLDENFTHNKALVKLLPGLKRLRGKFGDCPVILVGAGPSLDESMMHLQAIRNRCLIFTVGTALKPLLREGIEPDMVFITDPHPIVGRQIEGLLPDTPLVAFPTIHPSVLGLYPGPRVIAYQRGVDSVEEMAAEVGEELVETGGSVITAALDIIIRMGCSPVFFTGADFGLVEGKTHAAGTMHGELFLREAPNLLEVPANVGGKSVKAQPSLVIYRKWVERRIEQTSGAVKFFNLSPQGAVIRGAPYIDWDSARQEYLRVDLKIVKELLYSICSA